VEHNLNFSDNIDYLERGVRDYYRFGLGLTYYFGNKKVKHKKINDDSIVRK
jgi:curli production assembly/transport component CsgG